MSTLEQISQTGDEIASSEQKQEVKEKMEIKNTATFQEAIQTGNFTEAAAWLERLKSDPKYDARWLDHRSREIMRALCDAGQLDEAEKYIDYAQSEEGRRGRKEKIERLRGQAT